MTETTEQALNAVIHPLQSLREADIRTTKDVLEAAELLTATTRVAYMGILEPPKPDVLNWNANTSLDRRIRVMLVDIMDGTSKDVIVSVSLRVVLETADVDGKRGRTPILKTEYEQVDALVSSDPKWVDALAKRGLTSSEVKAVALSAGDFALAGEEKRRTVRIVPFMRRELVKDAWAHPIGGLCAYFDVDAGQIYELIDDRVYPVPSESGDFDSVEVAGPPLEGLRQISITQPDGPSFTVDGEEITWGNWRLRVGYDHREGLILRRVFFNDFGVERPILYRGSISEMIVNYGDPQPTRFWVNYFDVGEFVFGRHGNSLELGCDCVGEIYYFDAVLSDEFGEPRVIRNAICLHEEDYGVLWKHTDENIDLRSTRRNRRLVVSFFSTVGNYDYGFYWYFYLDGTIQCEAKLTGLLLQSPYPEEGTRFQAHVAPELGAPYHQHLFSARLDVMVDGLSNAVEEIDAERVPRGEENPWGNAFARRVTRLSTEQSAIRDADASVGRAWRIINTEKVNRVGEPVGYLLCPEQTPTLLSDPSSSVYARATFATKNLWVTRYSPEERYAAGEYVNQNPGGDGLPLYVRADRDIDGQDIVLWHTFGPTHFPRVEDWPIMPVDTAKFTLRPFGFFDKNPALNVPTQTACVHHGQEGHGSKEGR